MGGRFSKILEFIGLVDDEPDDDVDAGRPSGGQTYTGQNSYANQGRRQPPAPQGRASRAGGYGAPQGGQGYAQQPRYGASPTRPDYDARQRRNDYQPAPSRYADDRQAAPARPDYGAARRGDAPQGYRAAPAQPDPFEAEFDRASQTRASRAPEPPRQRGNVVQMRPQPQPQQLAPVSHQTVIYYLRQLGECRDVINDLLDAKTVLLNLEDMDERVVQRSIDTLCGAAFALNATLRKASDKTYLIAPNNVEVESSKDEERY